MDNSVLYYLATPVNLTALIAASTLILIAFILILFRDSFLKEKKNGKTAFSVSDDIYSEILVSNETASNLFFAKVLLAASGVFLLIAAAAETGLLFIADNMIFGLVLASLISVTATAALLTIKNEGRSPYAKRMLISAFIIDNFLLCILINGNFGLLLMFPVMISVRYGELKFTAGTTAICAIANVISRPAGAAFDLYTNNYMLQRVSIPAGTQITFASTLTETFIENDILTGESILRQEISVGLFSTLLIIFAGLCMTFIARHGRKMILESAELTKEKDEAELAAEEAKAKIMMSQLQPHFLYNSLSAIMAIDGNPPETLDALADFSRYLRGNLDSLSCKDLVPFAAEMEHVERYLSLEKLRFGNRLNVVFDITTKDFRIPPLSVQMAVENAVKHGITQKPEGGTVKIGTAQTDDEFLITIEDDGVGFDTSVNFASQGSHVGLTSGVERVKRLTGGETEITSKIGEGTKVVIHLPREKKA